MENDYEQRDEDDEMRFDFLPNEDIDYQVGSPRDSEANALDRAIVMSMTEGGGSVYMRSEAASFKSYHRDENEN